MSSFWIFKSVWIGSHQSCTSEWYLVGSIFKNSSSSHKNCTRIILLPKWFSFKIEMLPTPLFLSCFLFSVHAGSLPVCATACYTNRIDWRGHGGVLLTRYHTNLWCDPTQEAYERFVLSLQNMHFFHFCKSAGIIIFANLRCEDSYTESLCCDSAFAHKKKFYIFKFPKRFLEISWREIS